MARRLAVADIHGEGHRLIRLLREANYEPDCDRLFLLGDYIDRGRNSRLTVELARNLQRDGAVALLGNHEYVCLQVAQGRRYQNEHWQGDYVHWVSQGGDTTVRDYNGMPPDSVLAWFENLPLYHEEPDCILVHAGLRPGVPLSQQNAEDMVWIRKEFHEGYRGKTVVFGHTPTRLLHGKWEPWYGVDKIGIDTGAVWGGCLTLFDLDSHERWAA